jgi:zinc transport system substrate-binding protein
MLIFSFFFLANARESVYIFQMQIICTLFMKKIIPVIALLLSLCSCSESKTEKVIYTSFYPIYDFTKRIVGDRFDVVNITPYGSEPHDYEPKARDIVKMTTCTALFINGLGLEGYASILPDELAKKTYTVSDGITTMKIDNVIDPHIWLSLDNAKEEMKNILSIMKDIDPDNASYYQDNYEYQAKRFDALKNEYVERFSKVESRYVVVSHAAFGYLCDEYGLEQVYVSGLSPDDEPTAKSLEKIISLVKERHISTIFYEELVSNEISKKIATETGVKTATLNPLEGLSEEESKSEDYLSVMKKNYDLILEALHDTV